MSKNGGQGLHKWFVVCVHPELLTFEEPGGGEECLTDTYSVKTSQSKVLQQVSLDLSSFKAKLYIWPYSPSICCCRYKLPNQSLRCTLVLWLRHQGLNAQV